jgi:hypothetical protein
MPYSVVRVFRFLYKRYRKSKSQLRTYNPETRVMLGTRHRTKTKTYNIEKAKIKMDIIRIVQGVGSGETHVKAICLMTASTLKLPDFGKICINFKIISQ